MSETRDPVRDELASWQAAWQEPPAAGATAETAASAALDAEVAKVKRCSRRFGTHLVALTVTEALFCAGSLGYAVWWVAQKPTFWRGALLALIFLLIAVAETFVLVNRRGTYRPRNETTQAFVELEWLRAQRQLRSIRFCLPFFTFEMLSIAGLRLSELASDPNRAARMPAIAGRFALATAIGLILLALCTWHWNRKVRRKMKELEPLRAAFAPSPENSE